MFQFNTFGQELFFLSFFFQCCKKKIRRKLSKSTTVYFGFFQLINHLRQQLKDIWLTAIHNRPESDPGLPTGEPDPPELGTCTNKGE